MLVRLCRYQFASKSKKSKEKILAMMKMELSENPEFDFAFPHLKDMKPDIDIPIPSRRLDFMESLEYKHTQDLKMSNNERVQLSLKKFVEGYKDPKGPIKWMSSEEKTKIHNQIETKMRELISTGLSREEMLYGDKRMKGVPLELDPFFMHLYKNRIAREMVLQPGESFSVQKIIDIALRQDIGPDDSFGAYRQKFKYSHELTPDDKLKLAYNQEIDEKPFDPKTYYTPARKLEQEKEDLRRFIDLGMKKIQKPVKRGQIRKRTLRYLNPLDIHWRNTALLVNFINTSGGIINRMQSFLKQKQQKKINKAIKTARIMRNIIHKKVLLPYNSFIRPHEKISLTSLQEDVEKHTQRAINLETGHIYRRGEFIEQDYRSPEEEIDSFNEQFNYEGEATQMSLKDLQFEYLPPTPSAKDMRIVKATNHAKKMKEKELEQSGYEVEEMKTSDQTYAIEFGLLNVNSREEIPLPTEKELNENLKEFEHVKEKNFQPHQFADKFFAEKAFDIESLEKSSKKYLEEQSHVDLEELEEELKSLRQELGIFGLKSGF